MCLDRQWLRISLATQGLAKPRISDRLWNPVQVSYQQGNLRQSILDGIHVLTELIRDKSGLTSDGIALVGSAFGGPTPLRKINRLVTESEKDEQRGIEQLLRGLYSGIRNPRTHERPEDSQLVADQLLPLVDFLLAAIDHSAAPYDSDAVVAKVFDEHFVANDRYAEILITRIPQRRRMAVLYEIVSRRTEGNLENIKFFSDELVSAISDTERSMYCARLSEQLESAATDEEFRTAVRLGDCLWKELSELSRIRAEQRMIQDIRDGRTNPESGECYLGTLGTWCTGILPTHLTLGRDLAVAFVSKLRSTDPWERAYLLEYFTNYLMRLLPRPSSIVIDMVASQLKAGDQRMYDSFSHLLDNAPGSDRWADGLRQALIDYQPKTTSDDDFPF
jgi:uncharacterized protein (TIGR02391 family)